MLQGFRDFFSAKMLKIIILAAFLGVLILTIVFQIQGAPVTAATGYSVISFEFAFTQATAQTILSAWGTQWIPTMLLGTYLDFLYIISYSLFIMAVAILLVRKLEDKFQTFGMFIALSGFIAGALDVIENINLIIMLNNPITFPSFAPTIATICAAIKFGLIFLALGFALAAIVLLLLKKRKTP